MNDEIIVFTEETLHKCHEKQLIRQQIQKKKSKYGDIVLPERPDGISGYHRTCYKLFTALKVKATNKQIAHTNIGPLRE